MGGYQRLYTRLGYVGPLVAGGNWLDANDTFSDMCVYSPTLVAGIVISIEHYPFSLFL